jgi:cellulose synthase/poly-beta-1,6-N-acetylglucosamine synthase-like glycosyltransferase
MLVGLLSVLVLLYAIAVASSALGAMRSVPLVSDIAPRPLARWPRVSVVIPACNEGDTIEQALVSRLEEGYPDAEYIVVDDRSTDGTGAIIDRLAARDPRIIALHIEELPDGWLGKVHALHVGVRRATGDFILFSDADIHHEPGTLARIVAHCEEHAIDHVAVLPSIWSSTIALDVFLNSFIRHFVVGARAWKIGDPRSSVSIGGGVFGLVRRSALDRAGGLAPLALEVCDDIALGQMLKQTGARQALLNARGFVGLHFYRSLPEAVRGMEKNAFALMGYSVLRFSIFASLYTFAELGAFALIAGAHGWPCVVAATAAAVLLGTQLAVSRWLGRPLLPSLLAPIGIVTMIFGATRSMVMTLVRGGVVWRGTRYPLSVLRRGRRFVLT